MKRPKIVICGSRRFYDEIRRDAEILRDMGYIVFEPILNRDKRINEIPPNLGKLAFRGLTLHHFNLIRKADVCLIYNQGGYTGLSTALELGYAVACELLICALEEDRDSCVNSLFDLRSDRVSLLGEYLKDY